MLFSICSELLKLAGLIPRGTFTHTNKMSLPVWGPRLQPLWLAKGVHTRTYFSPQVALHAGHWQRSARETSATNEILTDPPQPCMAESLLLPLLLPRIVNCWVEGRTTEQAITSIQHARPPHQPSIISRRPRPRPNA